MESYIILIFFCKLFPNYSLRIFIFVCCWRTRIFILCESCHIYTGNILLKFYKMFPKQKMHIFFSIVTANTVLSIVVDVSLSHDLINGSSVLCPDLLWILVTLGGKALTEHYSASLHITSTSLITIITLNIFLAV